MNNRDRNILNDFENADWQKPCEVFARAQGAFNDPAWRTLGSIFIDDAMTLAFQSGELTLDENAKDYDWIKTIKGYDPAKLAGKSAGALVIKPDGTISDAENSLLAYQGKDRQASRSGVRMINILGGKKYDYDSRIRRFLSNCDCILLARTWNGYFDIALIFTSELNLNDFKRSKDCISLKAIDGERVHLLTSVPSKVNVSPLKRLKYAIRLFMRVALQDNGISLNKIIECLEQLDTKDQNENSLTQSNSSPMNAIQALPSMDSAEQESSVQPCVSTV